MDRGLEKMNGNGRLSGEAHPLGVRRLANGDALMYTKAQIRDQLKIARYGRLTEQGEEVIYFSRIIEEIAAGNYSALLTISYEYGISLGPLNRVLDQRARTHYRFDRMPLSCELETLRIMLGPDAGELKLESLCGEKEASDSQVRQLYFMISGAVNPGAAMEFVRSLKLEALHRFVWSRGLQKFLEIRYRVLKGPLEEKLGVREIIGQIGLPAIFDEAMLIQRFTGQGEQHTGEGIDIRDQLAHENVIKAEALSKINTVYSILSSGDIDFAKLERAMADAGMELEISNVQKAGIEILADYVRAKSVVGARSIALRYEFVCPAVSESEFVEAGTAIARSFFNQSANSKKGRFFLRTEVLYNLRPFVASGACHRLPGNYMLALVTTMDAEEHYLICRQNAKLDQDTFNMRLLAYFYLHEMPQKAVVRLIGYYLEAMSGGIRTIQALRKVLFASPIVVSLTGLVSILYYIVLGVAGEAMLIGTGILLIGSMIAAKSGYEEEIDPIAHQKIPSYIARKDGKVTATTKSLDFSALTSDQDEKPPEQQGAADPPPSP
jgi:hypothetical protein